MILSFRVPFVSHIPLNMQLISGGQSVESGCRVIIHFDSCYVQDRHMGALLCVGPHCRDL